MQRGKRTRNKKSKTALTRIAAHGDRRIQTHPSRVHLICNAHLDPVWLWRRDDGLMEAVATFRSAVMFCEKNRDLVFNHNESLLYETVRQVDPLLFRKIGRLVKQRRWNPTGGALLQADLNFPRAEALIRQFLFGKQFFQEHFGIDPVTALHVDSFGHPEGLVQILAGCGFTSYLFCRGMRDGAELPQGAFHWRDRSGASVLCRLASEHYHTYKGNAYVKLSRTVDNAPCGAPTTFLWGLGNHGGGASEEDLEGIENYRKLHPEIAIVHSTPEAYFKEVSQSHVALPAITGELQTMHRGCYSSSAQIKRSYRQTESALLSLERLAAQVWWLQRGDYPAQELRAVWHDLVFCQFHDILPGTCTAVAEQDALDMLGGCRDRLRGIRMRLFASLYRSENPARRREVPLFVYNPHEFAIDAVAEGEYVIDHDNYPRHTCRIMLASKAKPAIFQREKEEGNINNDWSVRVAASVKIAPFSYVRLDASFAHTLPARPPRLPKTTHGTLTFNVPWGLVAIDPVSGLPQKLIPAGCTRSIVAQGVFEPQVFRDGDSPWSCGTPGSKAGLWIKPEGAFRSARAVEIKNALGLTISGPVPRGPVAIVEDGPVRTVVEAVLVWRKSYLVRRYYISKVTDELQFEDRVFWAEKGRCLKLIVPMVSPIDHTVAEACAQAVERKTGPVQFEQPSQRWVAAVSRDSFIGICTTGTGAYSCDQKTLAITVVRSPIYSSSSKRRHNAAPGQFAPRLDQGAHTIRYSIVGGSQFDENRIRRAASLLSMPPEWFVLYPGGNGTPVKPDKSWLQVTPSTIEIMAIKKADKGNNLVIRLKQNASRTALYSLRVHGSDKAITGSLGPWQIATICIERGARHRIQLTNLLERPHNVGR